MHWSYSRVFTVYEIGTTFRCGNLKLTEGDDRAVVPWFLMVVPLTNFSGPSTKARRKSYFMRYKVARV